MTGNVSLDVYTTYLVKQLQSPPAPVAMPLFPMAITNNRRR